MKLPLALSLTLAASTQVSAQLFTSHVQLYNLGETVVTDDLHADSVPTSASASEFGSGVARADRGNLGAYARSYNDGVQWQGVLSSAQFQIHDLIFSSSDPSITQISVGVPLTLDGSFSGHNTGPLAVQVTVSFGGNAPSFTEGGSSTVAFTHGVLRHGDSDGFLAGYAGGTLSYTSVNPTVPTGVPVSFSLFLEAGSQYTGTTDFGHTLSLPTVGNVFVLPAGVTVNSPSLGIVNNQFAAVPESSHYFAFVGAGLGVFGFWRRLTNK